MKRLLTIAALCIGGWVGTADTANAQFFNYSTRLGNNGFLSIGNYPAYGGYGYGYGYPAYSYGYARPYYGYSYGYPSYGYGYSRPYYGYGYPSYGRSYYGRPYGWPR